ncbi:hypothetical protein CENSYa_0397 [Cenarchaeum symbiosum A]|uniref:Uncharacterized protein n=1 Tax=Cenarchaeum symbiosum (strain A) TaxID=414004 RepID=A0RUL6_CENSY|nr:hypothetical protein CENSYa_0397 [Cenarchaeum symbiosum A]
MTPGWGEFMQDAKITEADIASGKALELADKYVQNWKNHYFNEQHSEFFSVKYGGHADIRPIDDAGFKWVEGAMKEVGL